MLKFLLVPVLLAATAIGATTTPAQAAEVMTQRAAASGHVSARGLLERLHVKAESHVKNYERSRFKYWVDANGDGQDARAEVLDGESEISVLNHDDGTPWMGFWVSPYDGRSVTYASKLQVDHLVSLKEAWISGAWKWSAEKREAFANDIGYGPALVAVSKSAAKAKGDREPGSYLPPVTSYRCAYVRNWIAVKSRWHLTVDRAEKADLLHELSTYCSSTEVKRPGKPSISHLVEKVQPVDDGSSTDDSTAADPVETSPVAPTPVVSRPVSVPIATSPVVAAPAPVVSNGTYYANCDAVRAAGAAPLYPSQPGYRSALDADSDGIACEESGAVSAGSPSSVATTMPVTSPIGGGAICRDGTRSYSTSRSGTCSHHGGVSVWL